MKPFIGIAATLLLFASSTCAQIKERRANYLAAYGEWKSGADRVKPAGPSNKVMIECDRKISLCAVAEGNNLSGEGNLFTRLDVSPVHYTITHWDNAGLVAQTSARDCVTDKLVIDFKTKSVRMIVTPKGGDEDNEFCKVFSKPVTSYLVKSGG
jgi:hypothetical protein